MENELIATDFLACGCYNIEEHVLFSHRACECECSMRTAYKQ